MRIDTTLPHGFDAEHDSFRGELASVHKDGRRKWVYARQPSGRFYAARTLVSYVLMALLFLGPFVKLHGQPILLLNVLYRVGVSGDRERDDEEAARDYFDAHGRWPDE